MNNRIKLSIGLLLFVSFIASGLLAQEKVEESELVNFAKVVLLMQEINQKAQMDMAQVIEQAGFEMDRFNLIYEAAITENNDFLEAMTEAETANFESVLDRFDIMQAVYQGQLDEIIIQENLSLERFDEIAYMLEEDMVLQMRLQALLEQ